MTTLTRAAKKRIQPVVDPLRRPRLGLQVAAFSVCGGFALGGTAFEFANFGQLIALILLAPASRLLTRQDIAKIVLINVGIVISPLYLALGPEGASPKWTQILFFLAVVWQLAITIRIAPRIPDVRALLRKPFNLAGGLLLLVALEQEATTGREFLNLYFQDKTHAAVTVYCLAFIILWVNDGLGRLVLSIALYSVSLATASRLPALGVPFFLFAGIIEYRRTRKLANNSLKVFGHHLLIVTVPLAVLLILGSQFIAPLEGRLGRISSDPSTGAHFDLLDIAVRLKFSDLVLFVTGTGPGGFGPGAVYKHISLERLAGLDPTATSHLIDGFVPIHSADVSLFVEFPLWVFAAFAILWTKVLVGTWRQRQRTLTMMGLGILVVTFFYSSHNEYFYTVYLGVLCLASVPYVPQPEDGAAQDDAAGTAGNSTSYPLRAMRASSRSNASG